MMLNNTLAEIRRQELLQEAEKERLARKAQPERSNDAPVLARLGQRLASLDMRLHRDVSEQEVTRTWRLAK